MNAWHATKQIAYVGVVLGIAGLGIALSVLLMSGSKLLSVQSGSMEPTISKGDLVSVARTPTRDLRVGDVVTFSQEGQMVTHRIVALTGDMSGRIVTKGDANDRADQAIVPSQLVGRVNRVVPYIGFGVDFIKQPLGLVLVVYVPALILIINEIRRLARYYKKQQPYSARP